MTGAVGILDWFDVTPDALMEKVSFLAYPRALWIAEFLAVVMVCLHFLFRVERDMPPSPAVQAMIEEIAEERSRKPIPMADIGLAWRVLPSFWEYYERESDSHPGVLDVTIQGPLCPQCGRLLYDSHRSTEEISVIEAECRRCHFQVDMGQLPMGLGLYEAKLEAFKEAQRRAWRLGGHPKPAIRGHLKTGHKE